MSISEDQAKLVAAMKQLTLRWHRALTAWDDENRRQFEQNHLRHLQSGVRAAIDAMTQMANILRQVRCDCE
ncbi:MAG: hypothetical protein ABII12_10535 [Planctomycetota bacterium]